MLLHFIELRFSDKPLNHVDNRLVADRDPKTINIPDDCFAFRFYDMEVFFDNNRIPYPGDKIKYSRWYYNGEIITLNEIKQSENVEEYKKLIRKMESKGCSFVLKDKQGKYLLLKDNNPIN